MNLEYWKFIPFRVKRKNILVFLLIVIVLTLVTLFSSQCLNITCQSGSQSGGKHFKSKAFRPDSIRFMRRLQDDLNTSNSLYHTYQHYEDGYEGPGEVKGTQPGYGTYTGNGYQYVLTDKSNTFPGEVTPAIENQTVTKQLPRAIIIGVKKAGTRALLEFLKIHPDIVAPGPEPHFFDKHYDRGLNWYREQMPVSLDSQLTIEKTPGYFVTRSVPHRILNMSRTIRMIVVVRDPVTRAVSDYTQAASKHAGIVPFEEKVFLTNTSDTIDDSLSMVNIGLYAVHFQHWLKYFPLHQFHFVSGENLISNPAEELKTVQDFLGLRRFITHKHFYFNRTKGFPCIKKKDGPESIHCLNKGKGRPHPRIKKSVLEKLSNFYRPFNELLYKMIGKTFGW